MAPSYSADIFDRRRKKEGSMMFQAQKSLYRYPIPENFFVELITVTLF